MHFPSLPLYFHLFLSLPLSLFRLRQSITLPSPARRRACTHACVHARMLLTRMASTHARMYARSHARTMHTRKVSNLADGRPASRPTGGCWMLTPPSLSSLRSGGDVGGSGQVREGPGRDRSIPKGMRSLFSRVSILLHVQESMVSWKQRNRKRDFAYAYAHCSYVLISQRCK